MLGGGGFSMPDFNQLASNPMFTMGLSLLANPRNPTQSLLAGASMANMSQRGQMMREQMEQQRLQQEQAAAALQQEQMARDRMGNLVLANAPAQNIQAHAIKNNLDVPEGIIPPNLSGEYLAAQQLTGKEGPELWDYIQQQKMARSEAGASRNDISVETGQKFGDVVAGEMGNMRISEVKAGREALSAITGADTVLDLLEETDSGIRAQIGRKAANMLGMGGNPKLALIQQQAAKQIISSISDATFGALSKGERELIQSTAGGEWSPTEENKAIWRSIRQKLRAEAVSGESAYNLLSEMPELSKFQLPYGEIPGPYEYTPRDDLGQPLIGGGDPQSMINPPETVGPVGATLDSKSGFAKQTSGVQPNAAQQGALERARAAGLIK